MYVENLVPQLHPQELYLTINELGAEYAVDLLAYASPEQMTLLLDLDCWDGDNLSETLSLSWLQLLLNCGEEKICQLARQLEPELLALFLKKHLIITRGLEAYDDDDAENAKRLEGLYDIQYTSEDAAKTIDGLLKIWLEKEQESYLLLMEMIRSENLTVLEEDVYQTRNNRLLDLGIIPSIEAKAIYGYIDPDTFEPGGKKDFNLEAETLQHPAALIACAAAHNLLAEVLKTELDHATACELLLLANRKMSADHVDLSNSHDVTETFQATYSTINLALEHLAGSNINRAKQIFTTTYLIRLFQLGHSLVVKLQRRAEVIAVSAIYPYFDYPELLFIDSLQQKPAVLYDEGSDEGTLLPITSATHLKLIEQRLLQIESLLDLFTSGLPFSLTQIDQFDRPPTLSAIILTAVANRLLDRDFSPIPLSPSDLPRLREISFSAGRITTSFTQDVIAEISKTRELNVFATFCLEAWESFFSNLTDSSAEGRPSALIVLNND